MPFDLTEEEFNNLSPEEQERLRQLAFKAGDKSPITTEGEQDSFLKRVGKTALGALVTVGEVVDRFTGAPTRAGLGEAALAEDGILGKAQAFGAGFIEQFGEDPGKAPTGEEVSAALGIPEIPLTGPLARPTMLGLRESRIPEGVMTLRGAVGGAIDVAADPLNIIPGLSAASKGAKLLKLGRTAEILETATKLPGSALGRLEALPSTALKTAVQATTGKPAEALEQFGLGLGKGAKRLREAKPDEIGVELLRSIDNIDEVIDEAGVVKKTLEQMPNINTKVIADAIRKGKKKLTFDDPDFLINDRIERAAQNIEDMGSISATEFRDLRIELDRFIPANVEGASTLQKSFLNGRTAGAEELVKVAEASGNKKWATTMKNFSEKLGKLEKIKSKFGLNAINKEERAEKFIAGVFNKNNKIRKKNLKEFDEIFGFDFSTKAEDAFKAGKLGPEGIPSLLRETGAAGPLGGIASVGTAPITSPRISAGVLSVTGGLTKGVQATTKALLSPLGVETLDVARLASIRKRQEEEREINK